jgi:cAMP-binding proteins - catabolite gene activator and regulatory subunit of cAMP-dependent protein kinases
MMYLVGKGSVKISKSGRGGQQETLGFIEPGNFFGEMALLDGEPRSAMATAAESTLLGTVDEPTFQHILKLAPSRLHMNFLRSVTQRLRTVNSHFITEVMRSERLSLVGAMANSIIHDLKNPICIVRCCSDLIRAGFQRCPHPGTGRDDRQSGGWNAFDDTGVARLRARLNLALLRNGLDLAPAR